jgi:hypothetical protein
MVPPRQALFLSKDIRLLEQHGKPGKKTIPKRMCTWEAEYGGVRQDHVSQHV